METGHRAPFIHEFLGRESCQTSPQKITQITRALTWRLALITVKDFDVTGDLDYRLESNGYAHGHAHFCVGRPG